MDISFINYNFVLSYTDIYMNENTFLNQSAAV